MSRWPIYDGDAGRKRAALYESVDPSILHREFSEKLPPPPASIIDIGSGSGRDAAWLAGMGHNVVAVEPSATMRKEAQRRHGNPAIAWLNDSLPGLDRAAKLGIYFDAALLSAVWMHVSRNDRTRAFRKLTGLLKPGATISISLKLGACRFDGSGVDRSQIDEMEQLARGHGIQVIGEKPEADILGREEVAWSTLLLRVPNDETGALPLLRHVILNDAKSSTYKLGLLRSVARAADGAQGMSRQSADDKVVVPLGLIALNWLRLYKPLLKAELPQMPKNKGPSGLSFVGSTWGGLDDLAPHELCVGARFTGKRAHDLHMALVEASKTIVRMPVNYMTYPGSDDPILPARRGPFLPSPASVSIDLAYLWSFGELEVPVDLWRAMVRFDAWIEPALVSEWQRIMKSYAQGQGRVLDLGRLDEAMRWHEPQRTTDVARGRALGLVQSGKLFCVWTGRKLGSKALDIDHCLPWVAWPCGDLWNLMPSSRQVNQGSKRHRLPSAQALELSMDRILDWWDQAWRKEESTAHRFMTEARASLPLLTDDSGPEQVFEGLQIRRMAIRSDQQVEEWTPGAPTT